jgi:hypothetical protein
MNPPRRGMMMVVAIVLLGLIGVALASLTEQFGSDLKRLRAQTDEAQARQILIAATRGLLADPTKPLILPQELSDMGANLRITPVSRTFDQAAFRIDAVSRQFRASETLKLTHTQAGWSISDIQLQ